MTNGEKLCWVFPQMKYTVEKRARRVITTIGICASFDVDWWNTEYKEPTTKNDLGVDCISRQAVIDLMMQKWGENFSGDDAMQESIDAIRVMPSVTPQEPKTGHWIFIEYWYDVGRRVKCSECGQVFCLGEEVSKNYCANCGAKMAESEAEDGND